MKNEITDKSLNDFKQLKRKKNTWGCTFEIYGKRTTFLIKKINNIYILYITQMDLKEMFENGVCLGLVNKKDDLQNLFTSITRGMVLT